MIASVHHARVGHPGHYVFHYGSEQVLAQVDRLPEVHLCTAISLLQDDIPLNHLTTGAQPTTPAPNLYHPNIGPGGSLSTFPAQYPANGVHAYSQDSAPVAALPPNTRGPHVQLPSTYPAPGFDAYGNRTSSMGMGMGLGDPTAPYTLTIRRAFSLMPELALNP
jgi:hypothetical protein